MEIQEIAQVCHEINKVYCEAIGDFSQPDWEEAPEWQKESAIQGVEFHLENPDAGPEASHENWLHKKLNDGWKWGKEKDVENKLHPCCCPFSHLPVDQQVKDHLFRQVVHSLSAFVEV